MPQTDELSLSAGRQEFLRNPAEFVVDVPGSALMRCRQTHHAVRRPTVHSVNPDAGQRELASARTA